MSESEITSLAREYAEEIYPNLSDKIISRRTQEIKDAERVIHFLLRRYALVEKSVVEFEYNEVKEYLEKDRYLDMYDEYEAKRGLLEYLFPEIAKEVEG